MLAAVLSLLLDLDHCARWQATPDGPRCADIKLEARCPWDGWHTVYQGIAVCVRECGPEGKPTS